MIRLILAMVVFVASVATVHAAVEERSVVAKGEGLSRQAALMQALTNATGQAFGLQLTSDTLSSSLGIAVDSSQASEAVFMDALSQMVRERVTTNENQPVTGYRVLSDQKFSDGWIVEVEMTYAYYQPLGQKSNRRSAVVVGRDHDDKLLRDKVEQALIASRKFDVVSRRDQNIFADEKSFIRGDDAGSLEVARIGGAQGADYMIIVDVITLQKGINKETVLTTTGEKVFDSFFNLRFGVEVVEFTTREVKWKDEFKVSRSTQDRVGNAEAWILKYVEPIITGAVDEMVSALYPIRVISVEGDTFLVNRGSQYLQGNEVFAIYSQGQALIDPDTGESLGSSEHRVGMAEVIEVFPKFSRLVMTQGTLRPDVDYSVRRESQTSVKKSTVASKPATPSAAKQAEKEQLEQKKSAFLN